MEEMDDKLSPHGDDDVPKNADRLSWGSRNHKLTQTLDHRSQINAMRQGINCSLLFHKGQIAPAVGHDGLPAGPRGPLRSPGARWADPKWWLLHVRRSIVQGHTSHQVFVFVFCIPVYLCLFCHFRINLFGFRRVQDAPTKDRGLSKISRVVPRDQS